MKTNRNTSRRNFLVAASLGGAGAAAAIVAGKKAAEGTATAGAEAKTRGYHVSEHILKYYKTTQV
jgi:predicted naringenin-chalcone synthase